MNELRPIPDYHGLLASDDGHVFKQYDDGTLRRLPERVRSDGYIVVDMSKVYRSELGEWDNPESFISLA